jgi:hypothetical protein
LTASPQVAVRQLVRQAPGCTSLLLAPLSQLLEVVDDAVAAARAISAAVFTAVAGLEVGGHAISATRCDARSGDADAVLTAQCTVDVGKRERSGDHDAGAVGCDTEPHCAIDETDPPGRTVVGARAADRGVAVDVGAKAPAEDRAEEHNQVPPSKRDRHHE